MHGESITVPLTQGKVAIIDAEDAERVLAHRWYLLHTKGKCYASTTVQGRTTYLHRLVMSARQGQMVDHKNGDGLDCRKQNLRFCTATQNQANSPRHKLGPSGFRGVVKKRDKWAAMISIGNRRRYLGTFTDPVAAALCYDAKARELWDEFAVLNFPS